MGKVTWDDSTSRKLLSILTDDKDRGCTKYNWKSYAKNLSARFEVNVTTTQCINHIDMLKCKYKTYLALQKLTGITIDPITKEVDVEERATDRWEAFLEVCYIN